MRIPFAIFESGCEAASGFGKKQFQSARWIKAFVRAAAALESALGNFSRWWWPVDIGKHTEKMSHVVPRVSGVATL